MRMHSQLHGSSDYSDYLLLKSIGIVVHILPAVHAHVHTDVQTPHDECHEHAGVGDTCEVKQRSITQTLVGDVT